MKPVYRSVLLATSSANDVQNSGDSLSITGLISVPKRDIVTRGIKQIRYRAEVAQVYTLTTTGTPTAGTLYAVEIWDTNSRPQAWPERPKRYSVVSLPVLTSMGSTAALQWEWINSRIVTAINADGSNKGIAVSLGSGTGLTFTDDASYYPVYNQSGSLVQFINAMAVKTNSDGTGYQASQLAVTTAGVFSVGVGAKLAQQTVVADVFLNNMISGDPNDQAQTTAGASATSGQKYDVFTINWLKRQDIPTVSDFYGFVDCIETIYVDNGAGSSTTNLAGYLAFAHRMHKQMGQLYLRDVNATQEWFDSPIVFQDPLGAAATGTADTLGLQMSKYASMNRTNIGTQTKVVPIPSAAGYEIDQDDTATEGSHTSQNQQTWGTESFIVGQQEFAVYGRYVMGDYTDAAFMIGFRKKAVYGAVINNYTDYATIGNGSSAAGTTWINGDLFVTRANLNGGTTLQAISAVIPVDSTVYELSVKVDINGVVTAYVGNTSYPIYSVGTTPMVFDAGDEMIAFYQIVNIGSGDPACSIGEFLAVADTNLIS